MSDDVKRQIAELFKNFAESQNFGVLCEKMAAASYRLSPAPEPVKVEAIDWNDASVVHDNVYKKSGDHIRQLICLKDGTLLHVPGLTAAEAEASAKAILAFMKVRQRALQDFLPDDIREFAEAAGMLTSQRLHLAMLGQEPQP